MAADGVIQGAATETDPDGTPWAPLGAEYEAWKNRHYPGQPKGRLENEMLAREQVEGQWVISTDTAQMTYGLDEWNKVKAEWFQEGTTRGHYQPARPFYGLYARTIADVDRFLDGHFIRVIG